MLFIGADPGIKGAVAVLQEDGSLYNLDIGVPAIQDWTTIMRWLCSYTQFKIGWIIY